MLKFIYRAKDWINHSLEEQMDNMLYMYKVNSLINSSKEYAKYC